MDPQVVPSRIDLAAVEASLRGVQREFDAINERLQLAVGGRFSLPPIRVPRAEVDIEGRRAPLVALEDDWVTATRALIARKSYGRDSE